MTRRRTQALMALGATLVVLTTSCGTRLDDDTIARAAGGSGSVTGGTGQGELLPGEVGAGASEDFADGGVAGEAGESGTAGNAGEAGESETAGNAGEIGATGGTGGAEAVKRAGGAGDRGKAGGGGGPIILGNVGTYSGPVGVAYQTTPIALKAWAAATNAKGGLNGREVKVIVFDDGGDSSKARSQVQSLVEQHKAVAMVASQTTAQNVKAWLPYVEQKQFPVIGGGGCKSTDHSSPMMFPQCSTLADAAFGVVKIGAEHGKGKKFGALLCTESDDCAFVDDVWFAKGQAKRAGLDPVYRAKVSIAQPDFTAECIQARNAGVELLSVIGDANTVGRVASSCRRQNFNPQFLQPDVTIDAALPSKPGLGDVIGASRVFPFTGLSTPAAKEFTAAWNKHSGGIAPDGSAAMGWAASKMFEKAATGAGNNINPATLIEQLRTIRNERYGGLTVPLTFTAQGPRPASCMYRLQGSGGKWTAPQGDKPICF